MKIQSFSDIITNSSSEVFLYATSSAHEYLKEFIDCILKVSGSVYECEDLFRIKNLDTCLKIESVNNSDEEVAEEMDELINNLFYATD